MGDIYYLVDFSFGEPLVVDWGTYDEMEDLINHIGYRSNYRILTKEELANAR